MGTVEFLAWLAFVMLVAWVSDAPPWIWPVLLAALIIDVLCMLACGLREKLKEKTPADRSVEYLSKVYNHRT